MTGSISTGSSSTESTNPDVRALTSTIAKGVKSAYQPGGTTYVAPGSNTTGGWDATLAAGNNPTYAGGLAGALQSYANRASGAEIGNEAPGFAALKARLSDDVLKQTNTAFNSSGLFGSDQNQQAAGRGLAEALGGLEYSNYRDSINDQGVAADKLADLYQASLLPGSVQQAVGAAQDADASAKQNGNLDYLSKFASLFSGVSGAAGTTTKEELPLWRALLGGASAAAGL